LSSTTKEIVATKDNSCYFAGSFEFGGYRNPVERRGG